MALMAASLCPPAARADSWGAGIGIASDKVVRGLSQTGGRASLLFDSFYRTDTGWVLSAGAASLPKAEHGTPAELAATVSRGWQLDDDWAGQLSATHYAYPGQGDARYRPYDEANASIAWRGLLSFAVSMSPQAPGVGSDGRPRRGRTTVLEAGAHLPLAGRWSIDTGLGWNDNGRAGGTPYSYGSGGVSWGRGPVQLSLTWVTSRADERGRVPAKVAGDRWIGAVWWTW